MRHRRSRHARRKHQSHHTTAAVAHDALDDGRGASASMGYSGCGELRALQALKFRTVLIWEVTPSADAVVA